MIEFEPGESELKASLKSSLARIAKTMEKDKIIAVCLSGRGDKDANTVATLLGEKI